MKKNVGIEGNWMNYKLEELVPIVAKLAEGYTSKQSTSIPYEKAQQLMESVVYCIEEVEKQEGNALVGGKALSSMEMYRLGVELVEEKVKGALALYNKLMTNFNSYGNFCLEDTIVKGIPEFFKWYDCRFEPQNTILTLDYPILKDLSKESGIDRIYSYLKCVYLEQKFLGRFESALIREKLDQYDANYKLMIDNLCEIVLGNVLDNICETKDKETLKKTVNAIVKEQYEGDKELLEYLYLATENVATFFSCRSVF